MRDRIPDMIPYVYFIGGACALLENSPQFGAFLFSCGSIIGLLRVATKPSGGVSR